MSTTSLTSRAPGLLTALRDEWDRSYTQLPHHIAGIGDVVCGELTAQIRAAGEDERDRLLHALLVAAHDGDHVAERILLHHMLPKAVHYARTCRALRSISSTGHDSVDAVATAIGAMWQSISTYRLTNAHHVQGNLGLNALNIINGSLDAGSQDLPVDDDYLTKAVHDNGGSHGIEPEWGEDSLHDLVTLLSWAIDTDTLSPDQVRLLARHDLAERDEREAVRDTLAAELGIARGSLTRRVHRIRLKLVEAVQAHVRTHGAW